MRKARTYSVMFSLKEFPDRYEVIGGFPTIASAQAHADRVIADEDVVSVRVVPVTDSLKQGEDWHHALA